MIADAVGLADLKRIQRASMLLIGTLARAFSRRVVQFSAARAIRHCIPLMVMAPDPPASPRYLKRLEELPVVAA